VVDLNWYPLITTLYKKLLVGACFYTEQGDGKWIKQCESLFSVFDEKITLCSFSLLAAANFR
jgi:hypothetical protein